MDLYLLVKFLHVASAVIWIGTGLGLVILGIAAERKNDRDGFVRIVLNVAFMAPRVFVPASIAALVFGVIAAWMAWGFTPLWVVLGILGYAATFITGNFFLGPRAGRVAAIVASEGHSERAAAVGRELLTLAKFDYLMLFVVVADMVLKPTPADWPVLAAMAVVIAAGAVAFLMPVLRAPRPATA
jgi:uncharacterized membrane protein